MNNTTKITTVVFLSGILWIWTISHTDAAFHRIPPPVYNMTRLPQDAQISCTVSSAQFAQWFKSGTATPGGVVVPANSVLFPHRNNCDFYQWSTQMFLWVTSPATGGYGSNGIVLESPVFYDVSPANSSDERMLIQHTPNHIFDMRSHLDKDGPNRLSVVRDSKGGLYEIEKKMDLVKGDVSVTDKEGKTVTVSRITSDRLGAYTFLDQQGNRINGAQANIQNTTHPKRMVHQIRTPAGKHLFLKADGTFIESEEGQATGDALMTQTGSLVNYLTMVNDVYAWYLTAVKTGKMEGTIFPTTAAARDQICAFARANGKTIPDSNALAMELKSSWVEATTLPVAMLGKYVTVNARIPVYNKITSTKWVPAGSRIASMALIGMHVVGSVAGHPEMVWATLEHRSNAPSAGYSYINQQGMAVSVAAEKGTNWLLSNTVLNTGYNISHMQTNTIGPLDSFNVDAAGDTITANAHYTISPSNSNRAMPWGSTKGSVTNPQDGSAAASNSEVIALNTTIQKLLVGNDIRKNYLLIGATWTQGGAPPTGTSYSATNTTPGVAIGTSLLANSTMETYLQTNSTSCFFCHSSGASPFNNNPAFLSHMFGTLKPLQYTAWLRNPPLKKTSSKQTVVTGK